MQNIIWDELKFFLTRLKSLRVSESINLSDRGFCFSVKCPLENWIYWPDNINNSIVNEVMEFFRTRESFMWPIYNDIDTKILDLAGLFYAGDLIAMSLNPDKAVKNKANPNVKIERVINNSREWALTAGISFGSHENEITQNYFDFIDSMSQDRENLALYIAKINNKPAGTFLLTRKNGVYYFGTRPEFRRKGVAASMMAEICKLSHGNIITLQATPMGHKFYKSFGFDELFAIKVYSNEKEIF